MTTIKLKNGSGAPTAGDLVQGEPALDLTNKRLYTEDSGGTVIEVGTNPTSITTGDITATGINVTGSISADGLTVDVADQVIINHSGDGGGIRIDSTNGTNTGSLRFGDDLDNYIGAVEYNHSTNTLSLYADNATRVAVNSSGIDVTGTATATKLVSANGVLELDDNGTHNGIINSPASLFINIDSDSNNTGEDFVIGKDRTSTSGGTELFRVQEDGNVGIGTTSPSRLLDVNGIAKASIFDVDGEGFIRGDVSGELHIQSGTTATVFRNNANNTEHMRIVDSSGNVGIGTASPARSLHVSTSGVIPLRLTSTGTDCQIELGNSGGTPIIGSFNDQLIFNTGSTERMRISSAGDVQIGTAAVTGGRYFDIYNTGSNATDFAIARLITQQVGSASTTSADVYKRKNGEFGFANNDTDSAAYINFKVGTSDRMRIDSAGNVGIGTTNAPYKLVVSNGGASSIEFGPAYSGTSNLVQHFNRSGAVYVDAVNIAAQHRFNIGGSEAMRIDSSGNLLVSKTTSAISTEGVTLGGGQHYFTTDGDAAVKLNRLTSDGDIASFRKDGTIIGSAGSIGGYFYIGSATTSDTFLTFVNGAIRPSDDSGAGRDNAIDLGQTGNRFDDIYATNSTIQTSDRNEKQNIEELSDAEQRVAVACKGLLRKFRWKSAVEEKGDDARIHFGIIAQDLQDAFTAEGLDAGRYGMFINSTWTDEETGEERSRMGVRYSELLAFIISAI